MFTTDQIAIIKTFIKEEESQLDKRTRAALQELAPAILFKMDIVSSAFKVLPSSEKEKAFDIALREYLSVHPIDVEPSAALAKSGYTTWLTEERKKNIKNNYLDRYLQHLKNRGRSDKVVEEIAVSSLKIVEKLGDPKSTNPFFCKGLVVGSVQSGKTGNFNAVINRAIDCGYGLIIVFSGIMDDLRSQTQLRIEEDVIGEGTIDIRTDSKGQKGVGTIVRFGDLGDNAVRQVFSITSYQSDFKKSIKEADFSLNNKNILICKKNTSVLKNLLLWLREHLAPGKEKHDIPFLIVDDEADNASLNNYGEKGRNYASVINGHIRALLELFTRKTYLGYTATPFANVLQDRNEQPEVKWPIKTKKGGKDVVIEFDQVNNIFPDDFIVLLNAPTNYVGAKQLFETVLEENARKIPLIQKIEDTHYYFPERVVEEGNIKRPAEPFDTKTRAGNKCDPFPLELPPSLHEAIDCFILTIALRLSRISSLHGSTLLNPHHTMLVHISRFTTWQNQTQKLIKSYIADIQNKLENDYPTASNSIYIKLEKVWNKNYAYIVENIKQHLPNGYVDEFLIPKAYSEIKNLLQEAIKDLDVLSINSATGEKLEYFQDSYGNGKKIIAVGGNRLSRGFTLEGLTINYFIRNTNYSDTLLQMGRWFGYRQGYIDCCKIFTTPDAIDKFDSTTRAIEELEVEFRKMEAQNKQPKDFVLRVRKHPGTLKITRPSILKKTKDVKWSYQDMLVQTTKFQVNDPFILKKAWEGFKVYFSERRADLEVTEGFFKYHTDINGVVEFLNLPDSFVDFADKDLIIKFLELCEGKNKLINWCIAISRKGAGSSITTYDSGLPGDLDTSRRSGPPPEGNNSWRTDFFDRGIFGSGGKSANIVTSGKDFAILLDKSEQKRALEKFRAERIKYYIDEKKESPEDAKAKVEKINPPERIYREAMSDQQGLLVVYLMDIRSVYRLNSSDPEMTDLFGQNKIDQNTPLIGYALGFPPISPDPGGEYKVGDYDITDDEGEEEFDPILEQSDENES